MMIILSSFHSRSLSSAMSAMQNLSLHVGLWQAASGMLERSWRAGLDVMVAAWSPDDTLLAFSGDDGVVRIVDTAGVEQVRYCGHSDIVWTMALGTWHLQAMTGRYMTGKLTVGKYSMSSGGTAGG